MKRGDDEHQQGEQDREHGQKRIAPPLLRATEAFFHVLANRGASRSLPKLTDLELPLASGAKQKGREPA